MKRSISITKLVLLTALFFTGFIAYSNTNPGDTTSPNETERTIRNYFKFPQVLMPHYEEQTVQMNRVEVLFTTGKNGVVNFVLAKTPNRELKTEIEKQFSHLQLSSIQQNVVHRVVLNFRTI